MTQAEYRKVKFGKQAGKKTPWTLAKKRTKELKLIFDLGSYAKSLSKVKLFLLWKSSNSNKACARILIMQIERWALLNNENFVLAWISPIRHISQTAEKYGFCAICPHIKKLLLFFDFYEQCKFGRTNHFLSHGSCRQEREHLLSEFWISKVRLCLKSQLNFFDTILVFAPEIMHNWNLLQFQEIKW